MSDLKLQQSRLDGRYDILECLGRGSYAEIYVAHDNAATEGAPTTVVIKALNMFLQDDLDSELEATLISNFQNEAVALDRVRHPNIISRLGHGTAIDLSNTTFHYIVLEYLSGGDMQALSRNRPLSIEKTIFYLEQVCSGLAHAHAGGIIHRDIKPQNLLLTADRQIVKIADFGVARLEANEGAITRVGTNIYSAPEHNPLVQTGQLDTGLLALNREHLTPSADIYSLAKTAYSLLAGESPRRFAQHPIRELPAAVSGHYWSALVLRVLEKATQTRPANRYQTVQEFWDELAEAALPKTKRLGETSQAEANSTAHEGRKPSADLAIDVTAEEFTSAPPKPRFEPVQAAPPRPYVDEVVERRPSPKIVVPVTALHKSANQDVAPQQSARERLAAMPNEPRKAKIRDPKRGPAIPRRARPFLVAVLLVAAFSGMLLATHKYVTSHWNPFAGISQLSDIFVVGSEGVTTTDVNLRPDASTTNRSIGLAESGSRVKILSTTDHWYEVQVLEHGRPKTDPFTSDRGWINKKFVKF
ncbi:MAG TPA: protein kinase [Pyrinomonadaceae bacterium]|nr:protein kinase [Pyrinomonadaceae bacterium]